MLPPLIVEMIQTVNESAAELRKEISNIRYGDIDLDNDTGEILFNFRGETYTTPDPMDVVPTAYPESEASKAWALKQILYKNAVKK